MMLKSIKEDIRKAIRTFPTLKEKSIKQVYPKSYDRYDPKHNLHSSPKE